MAATNYTPIQLYFSTTASAVPLAANLAQGELAINITDGKLYYEDNAGVVQVIATKGAGTIGGSTTQIQYNNAGALAGNAAMTFNSGTNTTTLTTLNLTNALGATYGGTAQSAYAQGDFLYASATNTLSKLSIGTVNYILTSSGSVPQWSAPSSIIVQTATNLAGGLGGSVPYQSAVDTTTFLAIGAANRVMTSTGSAPQWVTSLTGLTGVSSSSITNTSLTSGRVVVSTTGGAQADDADLTFDGTTLSAGGYSTVGLTTLVKTVKIGDSNFNGVAVFAAATPAKLYIGTGTVTDTTSAIGATNAVGAISSLAITPIAATNTSVTYTNAATLYIAGAPSAGTNVTLTNPYSLYVAAGDAYFGGTVTAGTVNLTTLDLTNLEVTNIKAKDGTAAMTIADSTGVVSFTANPVLSGGTANGVAYLNGSKVLTTGSALAFDGSTLTVAPDANRSFKLQSLGTYSMSLENPSADSGAAIQFKTNGTFLWSRGASDAMALTTTGLVVGATSTSTKISAVGTPTVGAFAASIPNDPNASSVAVITAGANTNGGIWGGGGTGLRIIDKTSNSGSGQIGTGLYVAAPYDGTNASGSTYALTKYGIYVDDIYSFYGLNSSTGNANFGIYVKGGANNYIAGTLGVGVTNATQKFQVNGGIISQGQASALVASTTFLDYIVSNNKGRIAVVGDAVGTAGQLILSQYSSNGSVGRDVVTIDTAGVFNTATVRVVGSAVGSFAASNWFIQQEDSSTTRSYSTGPDASTAGRWEHYVANSTGGPSLAQRWNADANIAVKNIGIGFATPTTSGNGITFPATQAASSDANTLDDYEEGTWTPTATGGSGGSGTTTVANGWYVKIGRFVTLNIGLAMSSIGTLSGQLTISNLPFAAIATGSYSHFSGGIALYGTGNTGADTQFILENTGSTNGYFVFSNATAATVNWSNAGSAPSFFGSVTYQVA
jgi:hypothetical protein